MQQNGSRALHANVLILNRVYIATNIASVRRAFGLLWKGDAEVVHVEDGSYMAYDFRSWLEVCELKLELDEREETEDWLTTVNFDIQVPRVIRLLQYDRLPRGTVKFSRRNVFMRDGHCCQYCGKVFSIKNLSLDHVVPRSRGGENCWENIVCACLKCNVRKGGRTPQEAGMKLMSVPCRPKRNPAMSYHLGKRRYNSWSSFLR